MIRSWLASEREKIEAIRNYLTGRLSEFKLEHEDEHFDTGNYYFRFYRKGQGLRVEFTRIAIEDQSVERLIGLLKDWSRPDKGNVAVCVYTTELRPFRGTDLRHDVE